MSEALAITKRGAILPVGIVERRTRQIGTVGQTETEPSSDD